MNLTSESKNLHCNATETNPKNALKHKLKIKSWNEKKKKILSHQSGSPGFPTLRMEEERGGWQIFRSK